MSRTFKDRPWRLVYPPWWTKVGDQPKIAKHVDSDWHWLSNTPSWWNNLFHTRPKRRACRVWEQKVLSNIELDCPDFKNKPHVYYW